MAEFYVAGEKKDRPGVYQRYSNRGSSPSAGALNGVVAMPIQSNWGPLGTVTAHSNLDSVKETYGSDGLMAREPLSNVNAISQVFKGGATKVYVCRIGHGGAEGSASLKDTTEETPVEAVRVSAKYPGNISLSITIREKLGDPTKKQALVIYNNEIKETIEFAAGIGVAETTELITAINANSKYVKAALLAAGNGTLASVVQESLADGVNPIVTNESYSDGFNALEPYRFNVITVDTDAAAVHALLHEYVKRSFQSGKMLMSVFGEGTSVDFATRLQNSKAYNDEKNIYISGGYYITDNQPIDGVNAFCYAAGVIAATPSNQSIVHSVVGGAVSPIEVLTNEQYIQAIKSGMICFSPNADGQVWFDSGVNTLITLSSDQDEGWKKIRRTKTRFEMFDRIDRTLSPKAGKINCDSDGVADIIKTGQGVLNDMISEKKLNPNALFFEDASRPHQGDSAWFLIQADDIDSLEKIYLAYQFRYSTNS